MLEPDAVTRRHHGWTAGPDPELAQHSGGLRRIRISLASLRSYHAGFRPLRSGAAEAFVALPDRECSELYHSRPMQMAMK